jgi:polyisoprenyl-phosphate glycosyltransferase
MVQVVSVVCPLRSSRRVLERELDRLLEVLASEYTFYEVVLVDDASLDGTREWVENKLKGVSKLRYLELSRPSGKEVAILAGLESSVGDFVVVMTLGEDPAEMIPSMVSLALQGSHLVLGVDSNYRDRSWLRRIGSGCFHSYCRRLGYDLIPGSTDFRCFSRQSVDSLLRFSSKTKNLRLFLARTGFSRELVPYVPVVERKVVPLETLLRVGLSTLVGLSTHPLRVIATMGLLGSLLSLLYVGYVVGIYFFKSGVMEGWTTLSLQLSGMFFLLFLVLGVLCEYVGRVLDEVQDRPLYFLSVQKESVVSLNASIAANVVSSGHRLGAKR